MHFWLCGLFNSSLRLPSPKSPLDQSETLPKTWKQQGTSLNLLNNVWRELLAKREANRFVNGKFTKGSEQFGYRQWKQSPESRRRTGLVQAIFKQHPVVLTSLLTLFLSAHLLAGEKHFKRQERQKRHFSAYENCQNYLSEVRLACSGFWQPHVRLVFLLANKTWVTDPDLYRFVSVGLFSQHVTMFVMLVLVFVLVIFLS